jgi:hypothetical protein
MRKPASLANVEALFAQFEALYGARFAQMWKGTDLSVVKTTWGKALSGFTVREVKAGLLACRTKPWPPTLPEFLVLCRPSPDFEKSFAEAQEQVSKRQFGKDKWSSKALYWTAVEFGFYDLRSMSWPVAKNRWSRILVEKLAKENDLPEIPLPVQALPAPGKSETNIDVAKAHLAGIKRMIRNNKMKQEAI